MIVVTPLPLRSANFFATASVPTANLSNSKTPMGPFQMTVCVVSRAALNAATESGPISSPIQPSGIADAATTWLLASGANLSAMTTSVGNIRETPFSFAFARRDVASSSLSSSTNEAPTESPWAL
uniref:Phosphoglycerate kinase n=1 Tax=Arundo donax TaxID=35708 RepID=A0A0A9DX97_ARUDO